MKVNGKHYTSVWMEGTTVYMIDQNLLPFEFQIYKAENYEDVCHAITSMITRGAGSIGAAAAFGMAQAFVQAQHNHSQTFVEQAYQKLNATRPTAKDLFAATERVFRAGTKSAQHAIEEALLIHREYVKAGEQIAALGNSLIHNGFKIETHCNAGWLGLVDWGSALAPIYKAAQLEKDIFVWVDETRPRGQGARLTAWELQQEKIPHKIIPDNAGAHLMSRNMVDIIFVGADRIARNGDTANKIGTLEKAIAAKTYGIPFYVCAPSSTFDLNAPNGKFIPIEERSQEEVLYQTGRDEFGCMHKILVCSPQSEALNPAFDVTPAQYITGIITEKGIIRPCKEEILKIVS